MADMAPALTGAPQEAPHRLKLSASSPATERGLPVWKPELNGAGSLLLLNGRSEDCAPERPGKSRWLPEAEDKRPEDVPESGMTPVEDRPGEGAETGALCARRAARTSSRQQELGARARRLCRRLQVIQAKQVERHVRQQLAGLVELLAERGAAGLPGSPHTELDRLASSSTARLRAAQGGFDSDATESSSGEESDGEEASESSPERGERSEEEPRPAPGSHQRAQWRWTMERAAIICRWTWLQAQVSDLEFRIRQQTEIYKQIRCTKGSVVLGDSPLSEDTTPRQSAGPSAVLNTRGSRLPSSSCSPSVVKPPSANSLCQASSVTSSSSSSALPSADKQCSRLTQSENVACQNPPTKSVCDSPGSQKSSRQVNGFINCVRPSLSCNGSSEDLDPEEVLGKKRRVEGLSAAPALPDSSCMAARTRPLRGHKKRRLVRSSEVSSLSRKPQKQLSTKCGCEPPTTCILCGCKTYLKTTHPSTMSERIALIDPCYHPILSFPYGKLPAEGLYPLNGRLFPFPLLQLWLVNCVESGSDPEEMEKINIDEEVEYGNIKKENEKINILEDITMEDEIEEINTEEELEQINIREVVEEIKVEEAEEIKIIKAEEVKIEEMEVIKIKKVEINIVEVEEIKIKEVEEIKNMENKIEEVEKVMEEINIEKQGKVEDNTIKEVEEKNIKEEEVLEEMVEVINTEEENEGAVGKEEEEESEEEKYQALMWWWMVKGSELPDKTRLVDTKLPEKTKQEQQHQKEQQEQTNKMPQVLLLLHLGQSPSSLLISHTVSRLCYALTSSSYVDFSVSLQLEDLSAEAYQNRHSAYEDLERSRWDSWTSAAPQRRGSRSSNKSDGRWTPQPSSNSQGSFQQPASPDFGFHSLNEVPLTLSSAATDNQEPYSTVQCLSVYSRTRGLSWSEDTRSSTPEVPDEEEQTVAPWEHRSFPLSDRDHRVLQSSPVTAPNRNRNKPDVLCNAGSKSGLQAEGMDSGMSAENLVATSKDPPLPNSISVVRFRAHSGEKIASLEYFPTRPVNKR
ncbi:uncharacterized protein LOC121002633 [Bufo bufo]|uniref:uncharacterized protein LOC121002633 n=1 Tax=Bufo bufo TaxID=8384 RepID=UPI001ABEE438|nr:uncharacterized protein LOC121002633 [Bufo bufo]